jgi:hypothetical protein
MPKRRLERLSGQAVRERVRRGTGSEHEAVVLCTDAGERVILQRVGGNPFDDGATRDLAGRRVTVEGYRLGDIMRYTVAEAHAGGEGDDHT